MGGIPEYKPRPPGGTGGWFAAWRCRRKGGHYEGQDFVRQGNLMSLSRVCPNCNRYLGPAPIEFVEGRV